ncbi:MAG: hypothetical protein JO250_16585 [Armatimonadetes bacterium]|nr:hypothetical protein [Armatimonadota bacterium]
MSTMKTRKRTYASLGGVVLAALALSSTLRAQTPMQPAPAQPTTPAPGAPATPPPAQPIPIIPADKYNPAATPVALLVINQTKGDWADVKVRQNDKGKQEMAMRFRERGFPLVDDALVTKSLTAMNINLQDVSHQPPDALFKSGTLYQIGQAVNARLVALLVITDTREGKHFNLLSGFSKEGGATVKLWLVDAAEGQPLLKEVTKSSKSSGSSGLIEMMGTGGSSLSIRAIGGATSTALSQFLKPYKTINIDSGH